MIIMLCSQLARPFLASRMAFSNKVEKSELFVVVFCYTCSHGDTYVVFLWYPLTCPSAMLIPWSAGINQVTLLGRVGANPQQKGGATNPVMTFNLATNTNYRHGSGEFRQKTEWHRITVFRPYLRDTVQNHLKKGHRVLIQGKLMYGSMKDANGNSFPTTTIAAAWCRSERGVGADDVIFLSRTRAEDMEQREEEFHEEVEEEIPENLSEDMRETKL
ncbi:SSBP1 [Cordylochernes scorpioides]|uniref:SSBP1 n=1 Tax=Cordylochernes scorpioides TaxID=51811 RepID=A0ABY6L542_9ARAC|nr:SSBP1 [Cordylochernes scorpioides]